MSSSNPQNGASVKPGLLLLSGSSNYQVYFSSGGATAVLTGIAFRLAAKLAGIEHWSGQHGISGGSIVAATAACGEPAVEQLHKALNSRFNEYLDWRRGFFSLDLRRPFQWSFPIPEYNDDDWRDCRRLGMSSTIAIGAYVQDCANRQGMKDKWPAGFTTMATTRSGDPVVFHEGGVLLIKNGKEIVLSQKSVPLALAVRASCTIGGLLSPLSYKGQVLFDGALCRDGFCPVGIPIRHFGCKPDRMIAVRSNEWHPSTIYGRFHRMLRQLWRVNPDYNWGAETAGVVEMHSPIQHVGALDFNASRDEKWLGILLAFQESLQVLALEGLLYGDKLKEGHEIMKELGYWRNLQPAPLGRQQLLSEKAESVFSDHGLF